MKVQAKLDFSAPLPKARADEVYLAIIEQVSQTSNHPVPHLAAAFARCLVRSPSLHVFNSLTELEPDGTMSASDFYALRQIQALFTKREQIPGLVIDQEKAAFDKFVESEKICFETNKRLRSSDDPQYADRAALIHKMQRKISQVLGPCPRLEELKFGFGPGSNVGCGKDTSVRMKLSSDATATEAAGRGFAAVADHFHAWPGLKRPKAVRGSKWTSVPKTFKTNRGINVEPIINTYVQKGIGLWIRERLRLEGIDLTDQTANQLLAQLASTLWDTDWGLATIDLSMASDLIAYLLVMDLLPYDWFVLLDTYRCDQCEMPNGTWRLLEKFSSMGNGYTFELESLIFYAVLSVVCADNSVISVYGDDLICPVGEYEAVVAALELLGFRVNASKSFNRGPFRESCGRDFWHGTNVRPVFLKEEMSLKELYRLHNFFSRTGWLSCDFLLEFVPSGCRYFGPDGYGDGHLIGECAVKRDKRGWEPYYVFKSFSAIPRAIKLPQEGDLGAVLYNLESKEDGDPVVHRVLNTDVEFYLPNDGDQRYSETMYNERSFSTRFKLKNVRVKAVT